MKRFKAAAQRATAFVLAASMMSSAVLPTVFAAQPLNAENSVDELDNVDAADEDGTLVYPEWDDTAVELPDDDFAVTERTEDIVVTFPNEDPNAEEPEFDLPDDAEFDQTGEVALYATRVSKRDLIKAAVEAKAIYDMTQDNHSHTYNIRLTKVQDQTCTKPEIYFCQCDVTKPFHYTEVEINFFGKDISVKVPKDLQDVTAQCVATSNQETKPVKGHTRKSTWDIKENPTCTQPGKKVLGCTDCDTILDEEEIPANGHDFTGANWEKTTPATCDKDGVETLYCIHCHGTEEGGTQTRLIPHGNVQHDWEFKKTVEPTCTEDGYELYECTVCHTTKEENIKKALGHDFQNYVNDGKPACEDQTETGTCTRIGCGKTDTRTIGGPLSPHKFTTWTGIGGSVSGQYLYYESTCDTCHTKTKKINIADKKLDELDEALNGDPLTATDKELENIEILYNGAKAAIALMKRVGVNVDKYNERLNAMSDRYKTFEHESLQRGYETAASEAIKTAHETIDNKSPSEMTDDEMKKVIGAYVAADTAVGKLDDGRAKKTELQAELAELKKTVEEIESKYAQKVIESIWGDLKNGTLDKTKLEALKKTLDDLKDYIPDSLKESYAQVVDAVQAAIDAIDLVNEASALIKRLQEEIKNGNVSEDTLKEVQDVIDRAGKLVDKIKENPILKNAVDTIIKNAEEAIKEAAATKALEALKKAIESGDLSKIEEAFEKAQEAIDQLEPYAPDVAKKLRDALEEIKKTYVNGLRDALKKALEDGTYQEKLEKLKDVIKKYEDLIKDIDASGALKDLWETILNEELTKLITDMANEINKIVNDKDMSALEKIAALDKLYDDLHTKLAEIVGPDKAAEMLEPFDKLIEQAKNDVAKAAAAAADTLIKEALKAVKAAVDSAESKEDVINKMEAIYSQAHDLLTRAGMSDEDATAKLAPVRSALDSLKKVLEDSFVSMDTIKAAVDVIVDAVVASDSIEDGLYKLVRTLLDGDDMDPAVKKVILVVARDILAKADWTKLTPSLLDDVMDLVVKKLDKKYGKYPFVSQLLNELKPSLNELVHREVGQETIDKVREVFFTTIDNAIEGIDAGQDNRQLLAKAREDLMGLKPVVSAEMKRIGTKAGEMLNREMKDRISKALPGVVIPKLIGTLVGNATEDLVNEKLGEYDEKVGAIIEKYVKYLTCPGHEYEYVTIREATCTQDGVEVKQCKNCDWQLTDDDNKIVHEKLGHVVVEDPAVDPTETEEGLTAGSHCSRCSAVLEPQQVVPALQPRTDKWLVTGAVTTENVRAAGYENQQKLDAAINAVLTKAGFDAASSTRFFAQVNSTIGILPNDRYPEEGVAGMVKQPEATRNKNCTFYAVQVLTADSHGHNAGDVVVTPLTVTKEGISLTLCTEAVVAIAWKVNE